MQDTIISFYSTSDDYGDFSNFAAWPIKVDGKTWPTSEHYFQAQKFLDEKYREEIRRVSSPMVAARMGRDRSKPLRKNWESVKEQVMRKALRAKFEQHPELRARLLARPPLISPICASGALTSSSTMGSSTWASALEIASRKARFPAATKATSLLSTAWCLPS